MVDVSTRDRWQWIGPDGTTLELTAFVDDLEITKGMSGRGAPPIVVNREIVPYQAGQRTRSRRHDIRTLALPLVTTGPDWPGLQARLNSVIKTMDPLAGPGVLRLIKRDGTVSELTCCCTGGLGIDGEGSTAPNAVILALIFEADDPYWYGDTMTYAFVGGSRASWFPILPLVLTSSGLLGDQTIDTGSDVDTWPVWTIVGPGDEPSLVNNTTGRTVAFKSGVSLLANETITIDTRPGAKSVIGPDGTNWRKYLSDQSLWPLIPGLNDVNLEIGSATSASYISVAYRKATLMA